MHRQKSGLYIAFVAVGLGLLALALYMPRPSQKPPTKPVDIAAAYAPWRACGPMPDEGGGDDTNAASKLIDPSTAASFKPDLAYLLRAIPPAIYGAIEQLGMRIHVAEIDQPRIFCGGRAEDSNDTPGVGAACFDYSGDKHTPVLHIAIAKDPADPGGPKRALHQLLIPALTQFYFEHLLPDVLPPYQARSEGPNIRMGLAVLHGKMAEAFRQAGPQATAQLLAGYGEAWPLQPMAARRTSAFAVDWFYCSAASRAKFHELYPAAEAFFARNFQCILGKPWYEAGPEALCG